MPVDPITLGFVLALAGPGVKPAPRLADPAVATATTAPSVELLEFLGSWQAGGETWVGPMDVEAVTLPSVRPDPNENDSATGKNGDAAIRQRPEVTP